MQRKRLEKGRLSMANEKQLNALEKQLSLIETFYADENQEAACDKLEWLLARCDGNPQPPDWIEGSYRALFAHSIQDVMDQLGCE